MMQDICCYRCPLCHKELLREEDRYLCPACGKDYPIEDGIADFRDRDSYWGVIQREKMGKLLEYARVEGWEKALEVFLKKDAPSFYSYILDAARSYWHLLLPLPPQSRVLDLGCGWGSISFPLSRQYERVFALDFTREKIQFMDLRCRQCGVDNIYPLCADALRLPFADGYFDLVVVYGVLEWAGLCNPGECPEVNQINLLREAHRVLKKGGFLYLCMRTAGQ